MRAKRPAEGQSSSLTTECVQRALQMRAKRPADGREAVVQPLLSPQRGSPARLHAAEDTRQ